MAAIAQYGNCSDKRPRKSGLTMAQFVDLIKTGGNTTSGTPIARAVADLRNLTEVDEIRAHKAHKMPAVTLAGVPHPTRNNKADWQTTGYVVLDFDHLAAPLSFRNRVAQDKHTLTAFVSPSGDGVKVVAQVMPIYTDDAEFKQAWAVVSQYYSDTFNTKVDASGKDIARNTIVSHDPEVAFNPHAEAFQVVIPGERHNDLLKHAQRLAMAGHSYDDRLRSTRARNSQFAEPKGDDEVVSIVEWTEQFAMVMGAFIYGAHDQILSNRVSNAAHALKNLDKTQIQLNEWTGNVEVNGKRIDDTTRAILKAAIENVFGFAPTAEAFTDGLRMVAASNAYDPQADAMRELAAGWDGVDRLSTVGQNYFGTEASEVQNAHAALIFRGLASRILNPGSTFDYFPVLFGKQGAGKSRSLETIGGDLYTPGFSLSSFNFERVLAEQTEGKALVDFGELAGLRHADMETLKQQITLKVDRSTRKYDRDATERPRRFIMVGTANSLVLNDRTGNRRFAIVEVGESVDLEALRRDRNQLLGQAAREASTTVQLPAHLWEASAEVAAKYAGHNDAEAYIAEYLEARGLDWLPATAISDHLKTANVRVSNGEFSAVMQTLGWRQKKQGGKRGWGKA